MNDSTLDLFCNHDSEIVVDTFSDVLDDNKTYWNAMNKCADDARPDDAVSIYEEWCVNGVDPDEVDNFEFTFLPDLTREED